MIASNDEIEIMLNNIVNYVSLPTFLTLIVFACKILKDYYSLKKEVSDKISEKEARTLIEKEVCRSLRVVEIGINHTNACVRMIAKKLDVDIPLDIN